MDDNLISQSNQTSNNNIFPSIQELDDLNKISEQEKNSMMCRYNIRVYFVYGFQVLAIIFFIVMVSAKDDLALYLSLMFFACFETAVITLNCVAIDEFKILSSGGTPLNQVLEKNIFIIIIQEWNIILQIIVLAQKQEVYHCFSLFKHVWIFRDCLL